MLDDSSQPSEINNVKATIRRPRRPTGHWVYYSLEEGLLWPCPVHWEWESSYGGWLPFYCSPTLDYIAADPTKVVKRPKTAVSTIATVARLREQKLQGREE
ncbi:hypothetical protein HH682_10205 [Rosenbergiella sp. S61]|uniref:WW domain-containing protein n=1 Tax=Rosenbergiella gaditana TaxID=2726987 RepID=A0ABS5SXM5_9GAMM|nr:hypothetical protein [Rosenbergiella gaditana]MBT0724799.1 hypothetical protein [Rosenbergiella gaditana]